MKLSNGGSVLTNALINSVKTEFQKAFYGVSRDLVVDSDDMPRSESIEDERKGYKFDEVADIRSLLDQFMTTTAADKALACFKGSTPKVDEWNKLDFQNNEILTFFRTRSQDLTPPSEESTEESDYESQQAPPVPQQDHALNRFSNARNARSAAARHRDKYNKQQQVDQRQQQQPPPPLQLDQGKNIADKIHRDPQSAQPQGDFRAQITGKRTSGRSILQELAAKLKKQEAEARALKLGPTSKYPKHRKYHDSADYP